MRSDEPVAARGEISSMGGKGGKHKSRDKASRQLETKKRKQKEEAKKKAVQDPWYRVPSVVSPIGALLREVLAVVRAYHRLSHFEVWYRSLAASAGLAEIRAFIAVCCGKLCCSIRSPTLSCLCAAPPPTHTHTLWAGPHRGVGRKGEAAGGRGRA